MNRITRPSPTAPPDLATACHRVLFPAASSLDVPGWLESAVAGGTRALIAGETREEYVARAMTAERRASESGADIRSFTEQVAELAGGPVVVAVDQEPWGIRRLHGLVPETQSRIQDVAPEEVARYAGDVARAARGLGISMFLSPVLDVLTGPNPWLAGRTVAGLTHAEVAALGAAVVRGTQAEGVATVAKHFPGFPHLDQDPALAADAKVVAGRWSAQALEPFRAAVEAGAAGVMLGPAIVEDLDPVEPASTSSGTVASLRHQVGFAGLVVSDDLDAAATLLGRSLAETAVAALRAGAQLLLVGGGDHLGELASAVLAAAESDPSLAAQVREAAASVEAVADRWGLRRD